MSTAGALHTLADGVHAWVTSTASWGESNAAVICGHGSSLLIDTLWDLPLTRRMLEAMRPHVEAAPIAQLVNTHSDGDHWYGNELVGAGSIISTEAAARVMVHHGPKQMKALGAVSSLFRGLSYIPVPGRRGLRTAGDYFAGMMRPFDFRGIRPTLPNRTFSGSLTIEAGGREVVLLEAGPAHTEGDLLVHLPDVQAVFAGDLLFLGSTPVMWQGSVENWIRACERILDLEPRVVLPGHGPVTDSEGVDSVRRYWQLVYDAAREQFRRGRTSDTAAQAILLSDQFQSEPFSTWLCPERMVINVDSIYRQLNGVHRPRSLVERLRLMTRMALLSAELNG